MKTMDFESMSKIKGGFQQSCMSIGEFWDLVNAFFQNYENINCTFHLSDGYNTGCYSVTGGGYLNGQYVGFL